MSDHDDDSHSHEKKMRRRRRRRRTQPGGEDAADTSEERLVQMETKLSELAIMDSDDEADLEADLDEKQAATLEKQGFWFRKKKGMTGKLATSRLGNALFKKYMDDESVDLFKTNKAIVSKHKSDKFSKELHKNIMRLSVKTIMLYDNHTFSEQDFSQFRIPFRKICNLLKNNYARGIWDDALIQRIAQLVEKIASGLQEMLKKYVKKDTLTKLDEVKAYLKSPEYWSFAHSQESDFKKIIEVLSFYLSEYD